MKIIDRHSFLNLPYGTIYCKYTPQTFGDISIKTCNPFDKWINDWCYIPLTGDIYIEGCDSSDHHHDTLLLAEEKGIEFKADYESSARDGSYQDDQMFCIYDKEDIQKLINKLQAII